MAMALLRRLLPYVLVWIALSEGSGRDYAVAALGIGAAAVFSLRLRPPRTPYLRWRAVPGLLAYFLISSVGGGVDVAWRALAPSMPLRPRFIQMRSRLTTDGGLVLFVWMISLMPGTATVGLSQDGVLTVHVIDGRKYGEETLRRLETRIARLTERVHGAQDDR